MSPLPGIYSPLYICWQLIWILFQIPMHKLTTRLATLLFLLVVNTFPWLSYDTLPCAIYLLLLKSNTLTSRIFCAFRADVVSPSGRAVQGVGLRPRSPAELWVRIPPGGMDVCCECCVLSGRGLCDGLITRTEESYRLWCVDVWYRNMVNEVAMGPTGEGASAPPPKKESRWRITIKAMGVFDSVIHLMFQNW